MCYKRSFKKQEYEQPKLPPGQEPKRFKPQGKTEKKDLASQIAGDKPILKAMEKDFAKSE
jgi:hypothetical protein